MTLPKRFISLLLVYCFVITASPYSRPAISSSKTAKTGNVAETNTQRQSPEHQSLANASSKHTSWLPSWLSSWFSPSETDDETDKPQGLRFRLSEAPGQPDARTVNKVPLATVLSDAQTQAVLRRLPPPKIEPSDETDFAWRERSLPPPRTGETIKEPFPAPSPGSVPDQSIAGPLEILRYSPEGEVPLAPNLSVTFSQPMVSITSQEEAAETVPVKLSPQPPGKWRWVGTKTLLFEPDGRFPMATEYSVTVPGATRSVNGGALMQSRTWTFTTPAPTVKTTDPDDGYTRPRDQLMFIEFDQRIDPATVLRTIKVRAGNEEIRTRLATKEEIESYEDWRDLIRQAGKGRWLAFRAIDSQGQTKLALPADAAITVSVEPGTSSAEGPRTTTNPQQFSFHTFGPLRLVRTWCSYNVDVPCRPNDRLQMEFSNPLNAEAFEESQLRIEPPLEGFKAIISGNVLGIDGATKPDTTYRVTINNKLRDQFQQTLSKDETVEYKIGPAQPWMALSGQGFVVLDPAGPRQLSLYSVNYQTVKVSLYAVEPADWVKFQVFRQMHYQNRNDAEAKKVTLPGRLISDQRIELKSPNEMIETAIDVTPALNDGFGSALVVVESIMPVGDIYHSPLFAWVQSTNMGLDAFADNDELIGWATSLANGAPLENVQLEILPSKISGRTGADGVAHLALKPTSDSTPNVLVAHHGSDVAILPQSVELWVTDGTWHQRPLTDGLRWYVFDDRKLYRPGEEVHLKGWIRKIGAGKSGDVASLGGAVKKASYSVKDEADNEVAKGDIIVNLFGGFDTAFKLPGNMNLGDAKVEFKTQSEDSDYDEEEYTHRFQVQEFRRPEFEVNAKTDSEAPLFVGGRADVSVAANYFAGGGLPNAEVKWTVTARPTNFTPPNRDDYTFGKWFPWWGSGEDSEEGENQEFTGRTDAAGKHRLRMDFDEVNPPRASSVLAQASVTDVNRQTWSSTATLLVHPADLYVGLKSDRTFVQKGEPLVVQSIVTDLDGKAIANREVKMRTVLLDWKQIKGEWQQVEVNPQDCSIQSATDGVKCTFASKDGGVYRVTATIHDQRGRANESELTLWVAGGKRPPKRDVEKEEVELIPDRKEYKAGDTASILVQAPFYPAEGVMSLRRSGILKSERFHMDGPTYTLRVPIEAAWTPNVHVQIDLVGAEDREVESADILSAPARRSLAENQNGSGPERQSLSAHRDGGAASAKRPAFASGELNLSIPPLDRRLAVAATPREKTLEPGGYTTVGVEVKDAAGELVSGSEVAVVVVDEAVLALTDYKLDDPVSIFYSDREAGASDHHLRESILIEKIGEGFGLGPGAGGGAAMETVNVTSSQISELPINSRNFSNNFLLTPGRVTKSGTNESRQIRLRENFNALAVFAPSVRTDANGRAQVRLKLPDNLTRYRVMAVAVAGGKQFGSGESAITARLSLMARPSAPRFLNFGDRFELPIVLQNQTDLPLTVDVAVRATNAILSVPPAVAGGPAYANLDVSGRARPLPQAVLTTTRPLSQAVLTRAGRRVTVPANDRVEVRIPAATVKAGTARFQIGAVSGRWSDAAEISLPVWTPATTEAFATYGEIDEGAITQPVKAPANVFPQFGGLEIETSSTQLQELTDAVLYLTSYSYECSEQLSSRIIGIAALRDVLTAFKAKELPSPQEMEAAVTRDLKRLQGMQNGDGGFAFWRRGDESWPYVSIHVAHALARARQKKFEVPNEMFERSQRYLREIESHISSNYSLDTRRAIIAYALYVRMQMGDRDAAGARKLIAEAGLEKLSLESVGWLLTVLTNDQESVNEVAAIRHRLNNRVTETAGTAHFVCSYGDGDYLILNSNRRADGIILEALIGNQPNNDLIPKIVRGLLAHRTRGRWENTQENVFILLALDRYFNTYEKVTPNFVARAWLGERFAGEQEFKGRSTNRQEINVPMRYLGDQNGLQSLILSKEGSGRLYYRVGMNYAPSDLNLKPADYGFTVERSYEAVDNPKDVSRAADGSWHIKAGARVRVRLTMVAPARRYHVALVDPLPAGFEALNPALAVTERIPEDKQQAGVAEYGSRSFGFGWWRWRNVWFDHQNLRDERAEAFTALLWEGVYNYSYVAR
ncbi:MAG: alpha-2-macroglobulin family protein, partial [Pyrinomonadaceae bacterium]